MTLSDLLKAVRSGAMPVSEAEQRLQSLQIAELGYATVDLGRQARCGFPEVVFAEGKRSEWIVGVVERLLLAGQDCLATRVTDEQSAALGERFPAAEQDRLGRTFWLSAGQSKRSLSGRVIVISAGSSDLPVAMEAMNTLKAMGAKPVQITDVGVAGIQRILKHQAQLSAADVVIVVAGMDGALPSVVGGLVACPVIAVPTSVGYGAAFGGLAALLTMLNSCSAGVAVVNIDAGFKAGDIAARILASRHAATDSDPIS